MGTRINIEIGDKNETATILFSNSHHPAVNAEAILKQVVASSFGFSEITEKLLSLRYTAHGLHRSGDRVFTVDTQPGDREKLFRVTAELTVIEETADTYVPPKTKDLRQ